MVVHVDNPRDRRVCVFVSRRKSDRLEDSGSGAIIAIGAFSLIFFILGFALGHWWR